MILENSVRTNEVIYASLCILQKLMNSVKTAEIMTEIYETGLAICLLKFVRNEFTEEIRCKSSGIISNLLTSDNENYIKIMDQNGIVIILFSLLEDFSAQLNEDVF